MGCGLRKLEDLDDSSPGKIFSTLKRPQVETKTDFAYEYVLLDFSLEASSNPEVTQIGSVTEIAAKVEDYYTMGYVVSAVHPVTLSVGRGRPSPASGRYRVVLSRLKPSPKLGVFPRETYPRLVIEECPFLQEAPTNQVMVGLLEKVNEAAKRGMRFVGFLPQPGPPPNFCNGADAPRETTPAPPPGGRTPSPDRNCGSWTRGPPATRPEDAGMEREQERAARRLHPDASPDGPGGPGPPKPRTGPDHQLFTVFNVSDDESNSWSYHEGPLTVKVTRKGPVVTTLDADWLELTTFYYKQGLALIDSFVPWEATKGDHMPKSLEGLFIYEEEGAGVPGSNRKGSDVIVVEQWTVIEGCEVKTDYGPLLHTLAEFGWLLTCVLPTPILRHDSEGNLATKQIVFLQRSAMPNSTARGPEKPWARPARGGDPRSGAPSRSGESTPAPSGPPAPADRPWARDGGRMFPGFGGSDGVLRDLDDGTLEQEDGAVQVTCM
ncbi:raftlin-2 isoform X2 [Ornithorhynchus anatinus]|uniref:Raftlin family member 2 n=1 Tax=Ornithorhynchus anatinus TaxID=9258 RepID=F6QEP3_ORNAN|nr:raftlin-2 isoform X2 [Ornithorhynchus anatinus]